MTTKRTRSRSALKWRADAYTGFAEGKGSTEITREIKAKADDGPDLRTVQRWRNDYGELDPDSKTGFQWVRWPKSFELGALPWEASAAVRELFLLTNGDEGVPFDQELKRPTVRLARWFWRVTMARPDMSIEARLNLARVMDDAEYMHNLQADAGRQISQLVGREWGDEHDVRRSQRAAERMLLIGAANPTIVTVPITATLGKKEGSNEQTQG